MFSVIEERLILFVERLIFPRSADTASQNASARMLGGKRGVWESS
jgi:hypothetical protein